MKTNRWLVGVVLVLVLTSVLLLAAPPVPPVAPLPKVTLAWDANVEPDVAGYRLYWGPGNFATVTPAGNATSIVVTLPSRSVAYAFYVTCFNTAGLESEPSNVVEYTAPKLPASPRMLRTTGAPGG
jgi:hypothetical protein